MTYYELVTYIEDLTNKTITDEIINKINNSNFDYSQDVMIRILDHIINVIFKKLNNTEDDLINSLNNIKTSGELTLEINKIKSILKDVNKLLTIKYFETDLKNNIQNNIYDYSNEYISIIKKYYHGVNSNDYNIILNNLNLMEEK